MCSRQPQVLLFGKEQEKTFPDGEAIEADMIAAVYQRHELVNIYHIVK